MQARKFKYMGCVVDKSFSHALLDQYPNRSPSSLDSLMRKKEAMKHRDIPALAQESVKHEARRYYKS